METTTIRVDLDTRAALAHLASESGTTIMETARAAAEALRRQRFGARVAAEFEQLKSDDATYASYLAEGEATSVRDGLD